MANLRNWQDKWQDGTYEKAAALETAMTTGSEARWPAGEREVLKNQLRLARERFKQHGYEADARECERLLLEIRALFRGGALMAGNRRSYDAVTTRINLWRLKR